MMNRLLMMCVVLAISAVGFAEMFGGTLTFKNGGTVEFSQLAAEYKLSGKLGGQQVEYAFSDLGQIVFTDGDFGYGATGNAVVVSKSGKRFSLTGCKVQRKAGKGWCDSWIFYSYLDPVTSQAQTGREPVEKLISLSVGPSQGSAKKNPVTGEFFPSIYNFDPFTGQKLEWANP